MKTAKIRKNNKKQDKEIIKEEYSIKTMIIITLIIVAIFFIFYYITTLVVKPVEQINYDNGVNQIDSSKISINNLLNMKEDEYYVIAVKNSLYSNSSLTSANYIELYKKYIKDYKNQNESVEFYTIDLDDAINKSYVSDTLNITDDLKELKLNDEVLFKIKKGKIKEYFVGNSEIIKALSNL